jgi:phosphatidylglycerophosphatase A
MFRILNYLIATGFGVGFSPVAPGTAGSLLSVFICYFMFFEHFGLNILVLFILFCLGVFVSTNIEKERGVDPALIVIDEIVGMGVSLIYLPKDWRLYLLAFLFFRIFDIWKPPPINQAQNLHGGLGVMLDDLIAGIYSLFFIQLIRVLLFA